VAASQFATTPCHPHDLGQQTSHYSYQPPRYDSPFVQSLEEADRKQAPDSEERRSCSGSWESNRAQVTDFMSHRQYAPGYPSSYESGNQSNASSTHQQYKSSTGSPSTHRLGPLSFPPPHSGRGFDLPPLLGVSKSPSGSVSPSASRSLTLPSVLNPVPEDASARFRRNADELGSPHVGMPTLPPILGASKTSATSIGAPPGYSYLSETGNAPDRRILTPKSPLRRAISLSHLQPVSGNINALQNPFPSSPRSRPRAFEPGTSGAPPPPTPPIGIRTTGYGFPNIVPPPADLPRRRSPETQNYSESSSPSYSAYDQDENSPIAHSASGYLSISDQSRGGGRNMSVPPPPAAASFGSQSSLPLTGATGQSTYQMMTLKTTEGDVRFPVDVQAASRVADEKRKRNAGASARFRERRKKKEMEAASMISKLEQQIKDISEDADFYKKERDVLAGIIRGTSGGERQLSKRPASPRLQRNPHSGPSSSQPGPPSSYNASHDASHRSPEMGRNVRRRTSSFSLVQAPSMTPQVFGQGPHQAQQLGYAPPPPTPQVSMVHQRHPSALQPTANTHTQPPTTQVPNYPSSQGISLRPPPPLMQAPPMTGPYNPFASRYDPSNPQRH